MHPLRPLVPLSLFFVSPFSKSTKHHLSHHPPLHPPLPQYFNPLKDVVVSLNSSSSPPHPVRPRHGDPPYSKQQVFRLELPFVPLLLVYDPVPAPALFGACEDAHDRRLNQTVRVGESTSERTNERPSTTNRGGTCARTRKGKKKRRTNKLTAGRNR